MKAKTWKSWIVLMFGIGAFHAQADSITNELFRMLLWDTPEQHIRAHMENNKLPAEHVSEILKAIVRAADVKLADDEVLNRDRELGCKAAEMKIACNRALSVMGRLRLPNCQDTLIEVYNRPDGVGRWESGVSVMKIGGRKALDFADAVLATNRVSKSDQQYLCREVWLNAAGYYDGGTSNDSSGLFREYIVSAPFRETKIKGAIFADGEESRRYEQYRLSPGREECLRLVVEKGLDKDGYFAGQLAGLLAERHVKESGGLSITNERGHITNIPRPSAVASLGMPAGVHSPIGKPTPNGAATTSTVTPGKAIAPRAANRAWIMFVCAATILAVLAALAIRKRS